MDRPKTNKGRLKQQRGPRPRIHFRYSFAPHAKDPNPIYLALAPEFFALGITTGYSSLVLSLN